VRTTATPDLLGKVIPLPSAREAMESRKTHFVGMVMALASWSMLFASLFFATSMTLVFPTLLAVSLLLAAFVTAVVVYDGESTWPEGVVLIGLYVVIAAAFWWG